MIYLDNAATSHPKPQAVYKKVDLVLRKIGGNPGRASHRMAMEAGRVVFNAREAVARLINSPDSSRVAFTKNATEAINIGLKGVLRPKDHVISTVAEHNSVVKTLAALKDAGVEVTKIALDDQGFARLKDIKAAVKKNTRAVAMTHASNVYGGLQPVEEMSRFCRSRGITFILDAAQTAGASPIDVKKWGLDVLAATGHKSCLGPQGTGFIYVRPGIELPPLLNGGTGDFDTILEMPERLEAGTLNAPGIAGLGAGVEFVLKEGVAKIRAHELGLVAALLKGLAGIKGVKIIGTQDPLKRVSLVAFTMEGITPAEAGTRLDERYSIMVRTGVLCAPEAHRRAGTHPLGAIRVSPGYFTTHKHIERFLKAMREIAR
ncbi:MAG: aminotransferase class V-fold PLP-dependent enzyme [Deltaproteobacteria bacterium]|nr:aminotransferase class V-fold PLP-dependent enzyme [Deltaproteobacteria bacterium]